MYMFSVPRGYQDGFNQWMKQIAALCLTAFMQTTLLFLGLLTFPGNINPKDFEDALMVEPNEYALIKFGERGTCLYRCGNERYLLLVQAPEYKAEIFGSAGGR